MKPNRRPIIAVGVFFASVAIVAVAAIYLLVLRENWFGLFPVGVIGGLALTCAVICFVAARTPRLAYERGELLVFSKSFTPVRVPIEIVEVFFLGSGPALPVRDEQDEQEVPRAANVVVRLAETASDWHDRPLPSAFDRWSDGYIVLSGTHCEPISHERLNVINRRLTEVRRQHRRSQPQESQTTS